MSIDWSEISLTINSAGRVRCELGWALRGGFGRDLSDLDLWFVWAGRGEMQLRDHRIGLHPGVCIWMRPGGRYVARQDPAQRLGVTFIHFDLLDPDGQPVHDDDRLPPEHAAFRDVAFPDAVMRRVVELCARPFSGARLESRFAEDPVSDRTEAIDLMRGLLRDYERRAAGVGGLAGTAAEHERRIRPIVARLLEAPGEAPPVTEMAAEADYSPDHFTRVFREVTGRTPAEFVVSARIDRARRLLTETAMPVGQIGEALGYRDIYFFSRQFRQRVGVPPSRYRAGASGSPESDGTSPITK